VYLRRRVVPQSVVCAQSDIVAEKKIWIEAKCDLRRGLVKGAPAEYWTGVRRLVPVPAYMATAHDGIGVTDAAAEDEGTPMGIAHNAAADVASRAATVRLILG
jgi:hypothetical protein